MALGTLQLACSLAESVLKPPRALFTDACGAPCMPDVAQSSSAAQFQATALASIGELDAMISDLRQAGSLPLRQLLKPEKQSLVAGMLIEEVSQDAATKAQEDQLQSRLATNSYFVTALYSSDSLLPAPWTTHQLSIASRSLLQALSTSTSSAAAELAGQPFPGQPQSTGQELLLLALPALLIRLQTCLMQNAEQHNKLEVPKQSGPDTFSRCLAGRQLAFLIRQLSYKQLGSVLSAALPCVLVTVNDQSPAVQCYGLHALRHIAQEALQADLKAHQRQLMSTATDILAGCDDEVWPVAAPTACALLCSIGTACPGPGYQEVMKAMLQQAEMQCHKTARRLVWLDAVKPVFKVLGLLTLRFFSTLMPLLLEWCREPDLATQLKALEALSEVIRYTWPRMPAHASFLWSQLHCIQSHGCADLPREVSPDAADAQQQLHWHLASIARMLYQCGGSAFQASLKSKCHQLNGAQTDTMLHAVASLMKQNSELE